MQQFVLLCMILPLCFISFFGLIGFICKKVAPKERAILGNIIYGILTFDAFIQVARIFYLQMMLNTIQFMILLLKEEVPQIVEIKIIGLILVYFNAITGLALLYLMYYVLNPKIGQS